MVDVERFGRDSGLFFRVGTICAFVPIQKQSLANFEGEEDSSCVWRGVVSWSAWNKGATVVVAVDRTSLKYEGIPCQEGLEAYTSAPSRKSEE